MRKSKKVFLIISIVFIILNTLCINSSFAIEMINPDDYNPSDSPVTADDAGLFLDKVGLILGFVRNISVIIAVISLMLIGIKYMLGSVEEKANYKATMWPYVVGCILAAGGTTIVTFIYNSVT